MTDTTKHYIRMANNRGAYAAAACMRRNGYSLAYALFVLKHSGK